MTAITSITPYAHLHGFSVRPEQFRAGINSQQGAAFCFRPYYKAAAQELVILDTRTKVREVLNNPEYLAVRTGARTSDANKIVESINAQLVELFNKPAKLDLSATSEGVPMIILSEPDPAYAGQAAIFVPFRTTLALANDLIVDDEQSGEYYKVFSHTEGDKTEILIFAVGSEKKPFRAWNVEERKLYFMHVNKEILVFDRDDQKNPLSKWTPSLTTSTTPKPQTPPANADNKKDQPALATTA